MTTMLAIFHAAFAAASGQKMPFKNPRDLFALIVRILRFNIPDLNINDVRRSCYFVPSSFSWHYVTSIMKSLYGLISYLPLFGFAYAL
jgi:hypothetical protein